MWTAMEEEMEQKINVLLIAHNEKEMLQKRNGTKNKCFVDST